jgi:CheY-like chemotaxis protein
MEETVMRSKKILVIEDNPLNMKLVRVLLSQAEYKIIEAIEAEIGITLA